jgi:hypothetical protein
VFFGAGGDERGRATNNQFLKKFRENFSGKNLKKFCKKFSGNFPNKKFKKKIPARFL